MTRVKICGITTADDARRCHAAGADLLGVIMAASVRSVDASQAAVIRAAVPDARLVGVVRDHGTAVLALKMSIAGVDVVQLHGCADPQRWAAVAEACDRPVLPAVTADQADQAFQAVATMTDLPLDGILLDLPKGRADAAAARHLLWAAARRGLDLGLPVMLAGALVAADLGEVRRQVGSCDIDTCRGTEKAPGIKDMRLVREFVAAARSQEVGRAS